MEWHMVYPLLHPYLGARDRLRFCQVNTALRLFRKWRPKLHVKAEEGSHLPPGVTHLDLCITRGAFHELELDCVTHLTITVKDLWLRKVDYRHGAAYQTTICALWRWFQPAKFTKHTAAKNGSIRLPDTVEELVFGDEFDQRLTFLEFPKNSKGSR